MAEPFADTHELIQFAHRFLTERTESLRGDAQACISCSTAAFPAILYAFATIDLLGALLGGDAKNPKGMTERAKSYMRRFMHYSDDHCSLLMDIFRHKIVHLAQPNAVTLFKKAQTSWGYWHDDLQHHLKQIPLVPPLQVSVTSGLQISINQRFEISISHFVEDVIDSVHTPGGYLHSLTTDADLQDKFAMAITDIYSS